MGLTIEQIGDPAALDWWRKAHAGALAMRRAGTLAAADEPFFRASRPADARAGYRRAPAPVARP